MYVCMHTSTCQYLYIIYTTFYLQGHKAPALPTTLPTTLPTSELDQSDSDAECSESSEDDQEVHRHLASITRSFMLQAPSLSTSVNLLLL